LINETTSSVVPRAGDTEQCNNISRFARLVADLSDLLSGYYDSAAGSSQEANSEEAIVRAIRPLLSGTLHLSRPTGREDIEDRCQEALIRIAGALRESKQSTRRITNLLGYAVKVAKSVRNERIRSQHPFRARELHLVFLATDPNHALTFGRWELESAWIFGLRKWLGQRPRSTPRLQEYLKDETAFVTSGLEGYDLAHASLKLHMLVRYLLEWVSTPLLQRIVLEQLQRLRPVEAVTEVQMPEHADQVLPQYTDKPLGEYDWSEIYQALCSRPVNTRRAVILGLDSIYLESLIGQKSPHVEIAARIELPQQRVAELWPRLPLLDAEIAALLGTSANNVQRMRSAFMALVREQQNFPTRL
jgi:DNA-directed RNA polymerase specialized sigma24 family protein